MMSKQLSIFLCAAFVVLNVYFMFIVWNEFWPIDRGMTLYCLILMIGASVRDVFRTLNRWTKEDKKV